MKFFGYFTFVLLCWLSTAGISKSESIKEKLIISNCMFGKLKDKANLLAHSKKFSLIETVLDDDTLSTLNENKSICGNFLNLDSYYANKALNAMNSQQILSKLTQKKSFQLKARFQ